MGKIEIYIIRNFARNTGVMKNQTEEKEVQSSLYPSYVKEYGYSNVSNQEE